MAAETASNKYWDAFMYSQSAEETQSVFSKYGTEQYDKAHDELGFAVPWEIAAVTNFYLGKTKDPQLLDIASGTGLVPQHLRKEFNYNGIIDVLDCNMQMLIGSWKKNLNFRNVLLHLITDDGHLPLKEDSYDVAVCSASFIPNHIPETALEGMIRVVKKGGFFLFSLRENSHVEYIKRFMPVLHNLEKTGVIEIAETKEVRHFKKFEGRENVRSKIYVIKRL